MALSKGGSGAGFKYKKRDPDAVKKRAEQDGGAFDSIFKSGTDTFRPAQGMNTVRFLPPTWEDPEHYGYDIWVHQYVGADNGSYVCPKKMLNKRCPICEAQAEANEAGEEEEAKQLKAVKKVAAFIIDRNDKKPIPKIWLMSWTMDRDISTLCHSEKTGKTLLLDDPEVGYDVSFKRTGQQLNTRYLGLAVDRDDSPLLDTQKEINKLMEQVSETPLPDLLVYRDEKYLEAVVNGSSAKKDPDDDEETPRRRRKSEPDEDVEEEAPSRRRRAAEPEEDESAPRRRRAAEPEDEPEDEPAPRRRKAEPEEEPEEEPAPRRRRAAEPEPEEEERPSRRRRSEPEDEPEEEPAPRRRRAAEPEPEEEERPSRRRRSEPEEEPEDEPAPRRRRAAEPDPDEADEPEERPRRRRAEPEEEDEPAPRRRR